MIQRFLFSAVFALALAAPVSISFAANEKPVTEEEAIEALNEDVDAHIKKAAEERRAAAEETFGKINSIMLTLSEREQQHFFLAYNNYNLLETVKVVKEDVGKAIDKCSENNPDMKDALNDRYKDWTKAIDPMLKESKAVFDNMMLAQEYISKKEQKEVFGLVDKTRDKTNNQIEKIPVTTPEACEYLMSKMDETQDNMLKILRSTLVTFPQLYREGLDADLTKLPLDDESLEKARAMEEAQDKAKAEAEAEAEGKGKAEDKSE